MTKHTSHVQSTGQSTVQSATHNWLKAGVLPVVVIDTVEQGLQVAEGLIEGGIPQIEITLRTEAALPAIKAIAKAFPSLQLSAGTVITAEQFDQCHDAGATLFISPGLTEALASHAIQKNYVWVPGVATASEMMRALELGYDFVKFFPAMAAGGPKALQGITAPLPQMTVVPTGGVTLENLKDWAMVKAVPAVGGSWLTSGLEQMKSIPQEVAQRAREAVLAWNQARKEA